MSLYRQGLAAPSLSPHYHRSPEDIGYLILKALFGASLAAFIGWMVRAVVRYRNLYHAS